MAAQLDNIAGVFHIQGHIDRIAPLGNGLINDTYRVYTHDDDTPDYVLQRINTDVFTDVALLQKNIEAVTRHLRDKLTAQGITDVDRRVLRFLTTDSGATFHQDADGNCWRMSVYIDRTMTLEAVTPQSAYSAGEAFGQFESMLIDLPETLAETIPCFHNLEYRLQQLREVVAEDSEGRVRNNPTVQQLLDDIEENSEAMTIAERMHRQGQLPKRICHCDTKVNNILFDEQGSVLCVVDLDTVMPSFIFSDYGDFLRSAVNTTAEDDPDISHIELNMPVFEAFTTAYLKATATFLTETERQMLPYAVALFPYMQAVRFLWDHVNGDHYWKCRYPEHNLDRARNQLQLFRLVRQRHDEMASFVEKTLNNTIL